MSAGGKEDWGGANKESISTGGTSRCDGGRPWNKPFLACERSQATTFPRGCLEQKERLVVRAVSIENTYHGHDKDERDGIGKEDGKRESEVISGRRIERSLHSRAQRKGDHVTASMPTRVNTAEADDQPPSIAHRKQQQPMRPQTSGTHLLPGHQL